MKDENLKKVLSSMLGIVPQNVGENMIYQIKKAIEADNEADRLTKAEDNPQQECTTDAPLLEMWLEVKK